VFHTLSRSLLTGFVLAAAMLAFVPGAYAAPAAGGVPSLAGTANNPHALLVKCQRKIGEDDLGVCCRLTIGNRVSYKRLPRRDCTGPQKRIAQKHNCPRRPVSDSPAGVLICCQYTASKTRIGPTWRAVRRTALMPAAKCRSLQDGKLVSRSKCAKIKSRQDLVNECKARGEGWVWENNRCVRSRVRDHRGR
jgi:hypothetical protein